MTTASDDVAALRRDLDDARARLVALERELAEARPLESLGRLTVSIAHDFRNVMAAIGGQNELLFDALGADSPLRRRAEAIRKATGWGERVTRELLAAGRPQPPGPAVADLNAVLAGVVRTLGPLLGDDIEVRTELDPGVGAVAVGAAALEQVVMNLILNARDAMPSGGRVTVCTAVAAHVNGAGPAPPAILRVEDTGIGMDEATRARAFEPYFTTKAAGQGTGLGLSTVHDVVTRHGGHVEVASTPGRGATFTVRLPRAGGVTASAPAVLVIEEEAGVRELIVEILELHDFRALPARDHGEAQRLSTSHAGPLALVIADAGPGPDAARRVERLREARPEARVLYLSGRLEDTRAFGIAGPTLAKPFTVDALVRKVREVLRETTG